MHLSDDNGYGYRESDVDAFINKKWVKVSDAEEFYNYIEGQNDKWEYIRFSDRFIIFLDYSEPENRYKPKVIFVANILLTKLTTVYDQGEIEHEDLEALMHFNIY
ncbi:MAG: hypothetical protein ACK4IY_05535, partial [Chitinophagales bacterium]